MHFFDVPPVTQTDKYYYTDENGIGESLNELFKAPGFKEVTHRLTGALYRCVFDQTIILNQRVYWIHLLFTYPRVGVVFL